MDSNLKREILVMHADVLNTGTDVTEVLASRYPEIATLLYLAQSLHKSLQMVPVSAEFVTDLQRELVRAHLSSPSRQPLLEEQAANNWVIGAAVGSAVTGLAVLAARRFNARTQSVAA